MLRWPCRMQSIFRLAGLIALLALSGNPAFGRTTDSAQETTSWVQEHLLNPESRPPFSFVYGRHASDSLLKEWPRTTVTKQLDSGRTEHTVVWTDPKTHLLFTFQLWYMQTLLWWNGTSFCQRWQG